MFGTWDLSPKPGDLPGLRYRKLLLRLRGLHISAPLDRVIYEHVRFSSNTTADVIWSGFLAVMQVWCDNERIRYQGVPVSTLKKFATGDGRAKKEAMIAAAKARGWNVGDDNQADAVWLLEYGKAKHGRY